MKMNKILDYAILGVGAAVLAIIQQVVTEREITAQIDDRFTKEETNND